MNIKIGALPRAVTRGLGVLLGMTPLAALAQVNNLGAIGTNLHTGLTSWGTVMSAGTTVVGLGVAGGGLLKLKEAAQSNGQQVKYGEGMWRVGVGAGLTALPTVINSFLSTTVGSGGTVTNGGITVN